MQSERQGIKGFVLRLTRNMLLLVIVVLLIGVAIGVAVTYEPSPPGEVLMTATAVASPIVARVGEPINFSSAECTGDIVAYEWDFGDETTSTEPNPSHGYEQPGWYNVTLVVCDADEYYTKHVICVGAQREDFEDNEQLGVDWELRPRYLSRRWDYCYIAPNIGHPTTEVFCALENAVGTFEFDVGLWIDWPDGIMMYENVYSTLEVAQGGELRFACTIDPEDLPEDSEMCRVEVEFQLTIREGVFAGGEWGVVAEYPMEGLSPSW